MTSNKVLPTPAEDRTPQKIEDDAQARFHRTLVLPLAFAIREGPVRNTTDVAATVRESLRAFSPQDALETTLVAQITAANAAALEMYRKAWGKGCSPELQARFLALADKATRTVALLAEALDRHRGRGQQQITVRHVTVNADQAMVADRIVTGGTSADREGGDDR